MNKTEKLLQKLLAPISTMAIDAVKTVTKALKPVTPELMTVVQSAEAAVSASKQLEQAGKAVLNTAGSPRTFGVQMPTNAIGKAQADISRGMRKPLGPTFQPAEMPGDIKKAPTTKSGDLRRPKTAAFLPRLAPRSFPTFPSMKYPSVPAILKNIANSTKVAGVVDRSVKEIQDLQQGYRFMRNPWAEANDSTRSRNFMNYEGPQASFKSADLKEKVNEGLKDEVQGHKYWIDTSKLLKLQGYREEARRARMAAGQETGHHSILEDIKMKMEKKSEFEKTSYIRHEKGKYVVYSHSGKHMGTYSSEGEAKHRLQQIEYFKKQGQIKVALDTETIKSFIAKKYACTKDLTNAGRRTEAFREFAPAHIAESGLRSKGPGPEIWKEHITINPIEKGASLEMYIYNRNRKTLLQ